MIQFRKRINGELISPPKQYPVTVDGITIYFCYNYNALTESQIVQLKADDWKEFMYNYEADNNEIIETDTQIIQNAQKAIIDPYFSFDVQKAYDRLWKVFFYKAITDSGMCAMILDMNRNKSFYTLYQFVLCKYYDGRDDSDPENIIQGIVTDTEWDEFMLIYSDQGIDLSKELPRTFKSLIL